NLVGPDKEAVPVEHVVPRVADQHAVVTRPIRPLTPWDDLGLDGEPPEGRKEEWSVAEQVSGFLVRYEGHACQGDSLVQSRRPPSVESSAGRLRQWTADVGSSKPSVGSRRASMPSTRPSTPPS